ncbi:hypothetical protein NBRC116494_27090 [Aurantivibrio plasticivorans]
MQYLHSRFMKLVTHTLPRHTAQLAAVGAASLALGLSGQVYAETLYDHDFRSGLGGFTTSGDVRTSSYSGMRLVGGTSNTRATSQAINVAGYTNLSVAVDQSSRGLDYGESGSLLYSVDGFNYTSLFSSNSISSGSYALPEGVETIYLQFRVQASSRFENYQVRSVTVAGDADGGCTGSECCEPNCGGGGSLPPVSSVERNGPFATTMDRSTGPGRDGWVGRPTNIGQDGIKHPVLIWGPGAGTGPEDYEFFLDRMASHGFVVYSEVSTSSGGEMTDAIDWLISQNSDSRSPYYQKLDLNNIAAGGHSRGSIATFGIGDDPRLVTTVHVAGGSFDGEGSESLRNPTLYVGGTEDFATSNIERDYAVTTVPVFFTILDRVDHIAATREGMPVITAWLRWHLAGETERREQFIDRLCDFCSGIYDSQYKNW